jgi:hypothetical protein
MRPALPFTLVAAAAAAAVALGVSATAVEGQVVVDQLLGLAMIIYVGSLLVGSARWIGASSIPLLGASAIEAGFGDEPTWMRSLVIGCLWFVAVEAGWEAIDRRGGATYTMAATARRLQEVATVVGVSSVIGAAATLAAALAPTRSIPLQGLVVGGLLVAFLFMVRALIPDRAEGELATGWFSRKQQSGSGQPPFPDGRFGP